MNLVIVESPAKARTLRRYLGDEFRVEASVGHVRDLPADRLGVDVEQGFEPEYVTIDVKRPVLKELRTAAGKADSILLATDPDREGEAIAYHIVEALCARRKKLRERFRRVTFNEITRKAVLGALETPGNIDLPRVEAQQARRILDRLVGYRLSPLLCRKIKNGLSAGRVQSVAVRLLVARERERRAFRSGSYWGVAAQLAADGVKFPAALSSLGGVRVATGRDFDELTGAIKQGREVVLLDQARAEALVAELADATFTVRSAEVKQRRRSPYPPFTTATLQQEANRKLNFPARETMRVAQSLYEAGRITYMRTDSVTLSESAISAVRKRVELRYGKSFLHPKPRRYRAKSKSAQEAHEAIRPAGTQMPTSNDIGLKGREKALYDLIWKRTVATQMADARIRHVNAGIEANSALFRARGKTIEFAGFFRAYVEGSDDPDAKIESQEALLPDLAEGQEVACGGLKSKAHETKPPARYSEASLVKKLEVDGIGRPSTYASIISTILRRDYAFRREKQLVPTFIAFAVTAVLEGHFPNLVDEGFTSEMEDSLDQIAGGKVDWRSYLAAFYNGSDGLAERLEKKNAEIDTREARVVQLRNLTPRIRIGRYGPYLELERNGERLTATVPGDIAPADLSDEEARELLNKRKEEPHQLGADPESGETIYLLDGRFGPYVQRGEASAPDRKTKRGGGKTKSDSGKPKRTSLPKGLAPESVTLEMALKLLAMPAPLGTHPDSGEPVKVGIGRYGPYVVHKKDFRSLEAGDDLLNITLERALALLARPKRGRGRASVEPLATVGSHPDDGRPILLYKGRYGPYVKHDGINASLPKGAAPGDVTVPMAVDLLRMRKQRAASGGKKGKPARSRKKAPRKKSAGR